MERFTVLPFLLAMFVAVAAMPTSVYQICAWNVGTLEVEPWRVRTSATVRRVAAGIRAWLASLCTPRRLAFACAVVLLALFAVSLSGSHDHVVLAVPPAIATLQTKRAELVGQAEKFRAADGTFADDAARTAFDAKMGEVEQLDGQIREAEAEDKRKAQKPDPTPAIDEAAIRAAAVTAERERADGIRNVVRIAKLEGTLADDMVKRGITLDAARAEVFAKLAAADQRTPTDSHIPIGEDVRDKWIRGATNALLHRAGMVKDVAKHEKVEEKTLDAGEFRGLTLLDLARESLERNGVRTRGMDRMSLVGLAFTRTIAQTTSDFSTLLENVMHKVLQAQYSLTPDTWSRWCNRSTVVDFRPHVRYRLGSFGALDSVNEAGEIKNKAINDAEKASITAATKGNIIAISRQMIVNDDLAAFTRLISMLGRAAALSVEIDAYALLGQNSGLGPTQSDSNPLFYSGRNNIGTGAALSAASLDGDRVVLGSQKDPNGNEILELRPDVLLVPLSLYGQANVINAAQYDPDNISGASAKATLRPNLVNGMVREIIGTARLTGTRRYLFADRSMAPVFEVAFLEGQDSPVLESQLGWRVDGTEMKVRFDYGVAAVDYRGAVTNAGA